MNLEYNKAIGLVMKELIRDIGWTADKLARNLTIQCYKNLPESDIKDFPLVNELIRYNVSTSEGEEKNSKIKEYVDNSYKKANSVFVMDDGNEVTLNNSISHNSMNDYLNGRTPVPMLVLISFCQIFKISIDDFMTKAYNKFGLTWTLIQLPNEHTTEQLYINCFRKVFSETKDDRYVFDAESQSSLLSSLLLEGKEELSFHFTYLPRKLGLRAVKDQREVIYQRGVLTFSLKDGICYVTSKLEVSSQGVPTEYRGVAIVTNPNSVGPACTCFLKEINNSFGIFIIFSFRLSSLDKMQKRKTRISECIAVRKDDGTSYVYRLLLSKNFIDDEKMKYFVGHLKLSTSENTIEGNELNILIKEKYIDIAIKYFSNISPNENPYEKAIYKDLKDHFGDDNKEIYLNIIEEIKQSSISNVENIRTINPKIFNQQYDYCYFLLLGWLGKCALSSRTDKIENSLDNYIESIHKKIYPDLHAIADENELLHY